MARSPKKQRLNIFLMKEGTAIADVVRGDVGGLSETALRPGLNFEGIVVTKGTPANPPSWQGFVQSGIQNPLGLLRNQSASCLVALRFNDRVFAIVFGFGRHWIDERHIVRRFGMIVTLNVVHPERIRSVDREEFDTIQRKTRSQTSVRSNMNSFGLNVQRDLVRSVTGQPEDEAFAAHVTGADNLILNAAITFDQLGQKCGETLTHFGRERYRELYPWIDNFARITDPVQISDLDALLIQSLRSGENENTFLTPPDTLDTQDHRGFRYPGERKTSELHSDLRLEDFLAPLDTPQISLSDLKKWRIRQYTAGTDFPSREFYVYESFVFEVVLGQKLYVLSFGDWFEIAQDHVANVNGQLAQIKDHDELVLPESVSGETEGAYNIRAANASGGILALLDCLPVVYGGGRSSIEICDLLSLDKSFIHVKAKTKSSTLSHLFAQGLNSAQAFRDIKFRQLALAKCPASHHSIFEGEPLASEHTITYAIITRAVDDLRLALPFFSKQSLANAALALTNIGYQVRLKKIGIV